MEMNMKQSGFVIVAAVLMLSACGKKSEVESTAVKAPPPPAEHSAPVAAEQPMPPRAKEKAPEEAVQAPAAAKAPAPAEMEKPTLPTEKAKVSDVVKGKSLSREEGLALADKSGCLVCHKIETKLVGPAWRDVSKRYKGDPDAKTRLVANVKAGSKGNWTEVTGGIPMPPYSPRVSDENIEKLVTFVLSQ